MRTTAIPAQVTTVEDRIAGSLGMSQMVLLFTPIIVGSFLYAGLPPAMHSATYKLILLTLLLGVCCGLAVRIRGKIVLFWGVILLRYWLRPRYYVFDKRSMHGRPQYHGIVQRDDADELVTTIKHTLPLANLTLSDVVKVRELLEHPAANVAYEFKNGGLHVRVSEVETES